MSPLVSRLAALALAVGLLAVFVFGAALPVQRRLAELDAEIADLELQLDRLKGVVASAPPPAQIEIVDQALLGGETDALAAAELQAMLRRIAGRAGVEFDSVRVEEPSPIEGATLIPVTVELEADMFAVQALLHRVESQTPYLFVDQIDMRRARGAEEGADEHVAMRMRITGLARRSGEL